jgi:hypothetical protein
VVGEPEAAGRVEHQVVRPPQRVRAAGFEQRFNNAAGEVDPLDAAARVVPRLVPGQQVGADLVPLEAAVVAHVDLAVGPERGAVGAATRLGHHRLSAVGANARQRPALDLDQEDTAVGQGDRPLRELQSVRQL